MSKVNEKRHVKFIENDYISYTPVSTIYFDQSLSNGTENDTITFLNIPASVMNFYIKI